MELFFSSLPPLLLAAIKVSIPLAVISFIFGVGIAVITALARLSNNAILRFIFGFYVWIFRGTPLLVQLFIVFYGLPSVGVTLDVWACATIAFSLNVGAYASESVRAAILAVPKGQVEAAASLNMSSAQIFFHIVAPQAFRIAIPPLSNSFIALVKDTSLAASITMVDMFMVAQRIAARTYEPLLLYVEVALIYLVICTVLSGIQVILERKANVHLKVES
ncbi:MAG: amino acid ABC transporter permease [Campylobacter sp.]|uniref:Amino acid ABC transporter permease n=1 Tax=Campylobacter magnus TaxID=3026462 RepID=A0ABT8T9X7_9BACT|nr:MULTISPECIES: amino acid ABC transporter permease [Campylobacter]MDD6924965.1 amino acid ABC transporter permease [Campylobacteraceae bacterium]MDY2818021.1 amino acid ABC transporter permease [Campylobacter lanienae]MCI6177644.1 amino acid ABC transporter permease [Campylobacter sp.]MCI6340682.1 amino acid ABC transporter permease [Campylobacter sp.]MCI6819581.1 amino acid ABC transporter permease [Campylobacter sp.]